MNWTHRIIANGQASSGAKTLLLFDADTKGLAEFKAKFEAYPAPGYKVVAVLVADDRLRADCTQGDVGEVDRAALAQAVQSGRRSKGLLAADYMVSRPDELADLFAHVKPDMVLTDTIRFAEDRTDQINSPEPIIKAAHDYNPQMPIVLHTHANDQMGRHVPPKTEQFRLDGATYIATGKEGDLAHRALQGKARVATIG